MSKAEFANYLVMCSQIALPVVLLILGYFLLLVLVILSRIETYRTKAKLAERYNAMLQELETARVQLSIDQNTHVMRKADLTDRDKAVSQREQALEEAIMSIIHCKPITIRIQQIYGVLTEN